MTAETRTLEEIRAIGLAALARELGPVGMVRFLQQFEIGHGDYTRDRHQWLDGLSVDDVGRIIAERASNLDKS